jgi:hypothetical protein
MLPVQCPGCGVNYRVPPNRLGSQLHCPKCNAYFYLDNTGNFLLGKRPKPVEEKSAYAKAAAEPELNLLVHWRRIPLAVRALAIVAVVGVVGALAVQWANRARLNIPDDLIGRGKYATAAILHGDNQQLDAVAAPGTAPQLEAWADTVRGLCVQKGIGADATLWVEAGRPDSKTHTAVVTVMIIPPASATVADAAAPAGGSHAQPASLSDRQRPAVSDRSLSIRLYWTQDEQGQWLLDGENTPNYNRPPQPGGERRST